MKIKNLYNAIPSTCRGCSNHPINGGVGDCSCMMWDRWLKIISDIREGNE